MANPTSISSSTVDDMKNRTKETIDNAAKSVQSAASDASEQVQAVGGNIKNAIDQSVRDQPLTTLAMAVALGFVVGALWKS